MTFKQARWYTPASRRPEDIRLEVLHTVEAPETSRTAEAVANYFATTKVKASAHRCFDNDSFVGCVHDDDIAYAAPGANHDGRHYELAGYAGQSATDWRDPFSLSMLSRVAIEMHALATASGNALTWLSDDEIKAGKRGVCDHAAISRVYKKSTHTDCGKNFPKDLFVDILRAVPLLNSNPTPGGGYTIMQNAISGRRCPVDGGLQKLQADGGVFNSDGCSHYFGSWLEPNMTQHHAPGRDPVQLIDSYIGPEHYAILMRDGTVYDF